MGATPEQKSTLLTMEGKPDTQDDEKPAHRVELPGFYIGKYEITQAQWKSIMGNNPSYIQGDSLPVENVSWYDAQEFIARLTS